MFVLLAIFLAVSSLVIVAYLLSWWIQRRELETVRAYTNLHAVPPSSIAVRQSGVCACVAQSGVPASS